VGTGPGQRRSHGFLHDLAEMAGHGELLATTHAAGFDEDDVAAHGSPNESNGDARFLDAFLYFLFRAEFQHAKEFAHHFRSDHHLLGLAFGHAPRLLADQGRDFALEVPHARFTRVAVDDLLQPRFREFELLAFLDSVLRGLLRDQVLARDVDLLLAGISG